MSAVNSDTGAPAAPAADVATHAGLVEKSCVSCHNDKTKTAGLSLQGLSLTDVPAHGEVWEKVLRKVRSGEMPPPTVRTRPEPEASAAFAAFLERTLDSEAAARPNPGRAPVHRLNRAEYSNAIRDLLAVDVKPGAWLPVDDSGYGFDNIAAVLSTSPALLERYMTAARRISRLAVGDITLKPVEDIYDAKRDPIKGTRNERISDDLPFDSRAGISIQHYFPGRWRIRLQDSHPRSADRRERPGDRPVSGAHPRESRTSLGGRDVAARKSEGRERRSGPWRVAPVAEAACRRCRIRSISA